MSDAAKDLVTRLLVKDVRHRYTVDQMLAHPFVTNEVRHRLTAHTLSMLELKQVIHGVVISCFIVSLIQVHVSPLHLQTRIVHSSPQNTT